MGASGSAAAFLVPANQMLSMLLRRSASALYMHLQVAALTSSCACTAGNSKQDNLHAKILDTFPVGQRGISRQTVLNEAWAAGKQPSGRR